MKKFVKFEFSNYGEERRGKGKGGEERRKEREEDLLHNVWGIDAPTSAVEWILTS